MDHKLWNSVAARVLALTFVIAGLAGCDRRHEDPLPANASPSAQVIGTAPAPPTGDPPGTTPVDPDTTVIGKGTETTAMPLPGQPNDHSNLSPAPSQKAGADDGKAKQETQ
jgi:hypothetical protein